MDNDIEYRVYRRLEAFRLRLEADDDERMASDYSESSPEFAGYLQRRAQHKRWLANNRDGGQQP